MSNISPSNRSFAHLTEEQAEELNREIRRNMFPDYSQIAQKFQVPVPKIRYYVYKTRAHLDKTERAELKLEEIFEKNPDLNDMKQFAHLAKRIRMKKGKISQWFKKKRKQVFEKELLEKLSSNT